MQSLIEQLYHACFNTDAELELGATRMSIPGKCFFMHRVSTA